VFDRGMVVRTDVVRGSMIDGILSGDFLEEIAPCRAGGGPQVLGAPG
jgi:hypothetical protein